MIRRLVGEEISAAGCQMRRDRGLHDDPAAEVAENEPSLQAKRAANVAAMTADVQNELSLLDDKAREAVRLVVMKGMSRREAAAALDLPLATFQGIYRRSTARLAERLDAYKPVP